MHTEPPMISAPVSVDQDLCMASSYCSGLAPEVFAPDTDGLVALVAPDGLVTGPVAVPAEHVERGRACVSGGRHSRDR